MWEVVRRNLCVHVRVATGQLPSAASSTLPVKVFFTRLTGFFFFFWEASQSPLPVRWGLLRASAVLHRWWESVCGGSPCSGLQRLRSCLGSCACASAPSRSWPLSGAAPCVSALRWLPAFIKAPHCCPSVSPAPHVDFYHWMIAGSCV